MQYFFSPIDKKNTLYSVVPLALDPAYSEEHLSIISSNSDCLLLENQYISQNTFKYFKKTIALFSTYKKTSREKITLQMPFTSLLVGPAYSCKKLLSSYYSWAHTYQNVFKILPNKNFIKKEKKSTSKSTSTTLEKSYDLKKSDHWRSLSLPHIWAKATLSNVEIPCVAPHALKEELTRFFDFPITLTALPITSYEHHNEILAWTYALYSLSVAQQVGRHVLCHYESINSQYDLFFKSKAETLVPHIPKLWSVFLPSAPQGYHMKSTTKIQTHTHTQGTHHYHQTQCIYDLLKNSNYIKKKNIYAYSKNNFKCMGFSHVSEPILKGLSYPDFLHIKKYSITLIKEKKSLLFLLPFLPSINTLSALKNIVSNEFEIKKDFIFFDLDKEIHMPPCSQEYSLLGNLILQLTKKNPKRARTIKAFIPKYIHKYSTHVSCALEFSVKKYDKTLILQNAYISISAGYIAREKFIKGFVEKIILEEISSFLGCHYIDSIQLPQINISFIHQDNNLDSKTKPKTYLKTYPITHTSSISHVVRAGVWNAIHNTFTNYYLNTLSNNDTNTITAHIPSLRHISFPNNQAIISTLPPKPIKTLHRGI